MRNARNGQSMQRLFRQRCVDTGQTVCRWLRPECNIQAVHGKYVYTDYMCVQVRDKIEKMLHSRFCQVKVPRCIYTLTV